MNSIAQMMCEKLEKQSLQSKVTRGDQQSATSMDGGWTIPAAAHVWALNGFSKEIDMGHRGKASL
jgi:hypothetical protein